MALYKPFKLYFQIISLLSLFYIVKSNYNNDNKDENSITNTNNHSSLSVLRFLQNTTITDECNSLAAANKCDVSLCSINGGVCNNNSCNCKNGYISLPGQPNKCCYQQKSQLTAFLLEFIFSFGFGHFYIGDNLIGCLKLFLYTALYLVDGYLLYYKKKQVEKENFSVDVDILVYIVTIFVFLFWICWQVYDCVLFGQNAFLDSNGVQLMSWISK